MKLEEIASDMLISARANDNQAIATTLPRGLRLILLRMGKHWRLRMSRREVVPSELEVSICQRIFRVPGHATRRDGAGGRPLESFILLEWDEE